MSDMPDRVGITIEPIREDHVEGFREALDTVAREKKYLIFTEAPSVEHMLAFVRSNIAAGHPHMVALGGGRAEGRGEGRVVGWCDIRAKERAVQSHVGVLGMGIVPGYRDRGIGRLLITAALDAARAKGLHRVELDAHGDNLRAIALYEKVGFVHEGVARDAVRHDGGFVDSVKMGLIFG
jgi:RimJ/RimL family protein N-acetyltransferase